MSAQEIFDEIESGIKADPSLVQKVNGVFQFNVDGKSWTVDLKNGTGSVKTGAPAKADVTITANNNDFISLMTGKANGQQLFMQGKLKIQGNMGLAMKLDKLPKSKGGSSSGAAPSKPTPATAKPAATAPSTKSGAAAVFEELGKRISTTPSLVQQINGIYQFDVNMGGKTQSWSVDLKNGKGSVTEGKNDKAEVTLTVGEDDFVGMMTGKLNSQQLFMQGKLKIKGNMGLAMKLSKLNAAKAAL